ncbi:hypothetical protein K450DRAFT_253761 [Umbelopsis ramanniana AG]|uniref:Uncharacterized protein n=1 Tax=Umbelopsis ramanniana AG TaxID=1314678 RepID=A0AAD5HBS1_UMBRA|nr:uncharacterized protein K450DRAFT_253761 [Umbelopsis ramanniana AG]KAI8577124.1 hypothetical protein K450DRAFT_253761 [Umbelopsis ramanniana AG]
MQSIPKSSNAVIRWFKLDQFEPERAVTSNWVSSRTLLMIRTLPVLYGLIVLFGNMGTMARDGLFQYFFCFFTDMTYIGLCSYLLCVYGHHVRYLLSPKPHTPQSFFNQWSFLNYLFVILYHTIICFNIVTPVVFWALIYGYIKNQVSNTEQWWLATSVHAVSFFMMMTEVTFTKMVCVPRMVLFPLFVLILYTCLTFVIFAVDHAWVYPFLDWSQGAEAAIWYALVALVAVIGFFLNYGVHQLRDAVARRVHRRVHGNFDETTDKVEVKNDAAEEV